MHPDTTSNLFSTAGMPYELQRALSSCLLLSCVLLLLSIYLCKMRKEQCFTRAHKAHDLVYSFLY